MRKILIPVIAFLLAFGLNISVAQQARPATERAAGQPAPKKESVKTKKDGTPDMRYKENKNGAAKAEPKHLKKDGTPDKRYKENK